MKKCLLCQIAEKKISSDILFENDQLMVFYDLYPKARIHLLVIPKKHIEFAGHDFKGKEKILSALLLAGKEAAKKTGILETGFRLVINTGEDSGRGFDHLHLHVLGGEKLGGETIG